MLNFAATRFKKHVSIIKKKFFQGFHFPKLVVNVILEFVLYKNN